MFVAIPTSPLNLPDLRVDICWKNLKESMVDAAKKVCDNVKRKSLDAWWKYETFEL